MMILGTPARMTTAVERARPVQVLAVTGGKGGVGKTSVSINLGIALAERGQRVVLLDADLGLANIDVLLGLRPKRNLADVLAGDCGLADILIDGPGGIQSKRYADDDAQADAVARGVPFVHALGSRRPTTAASVGVNQPARMPPRNERRCPASTARGAGCGTPTISSTITASTACLLYTSDAADERSRVDLGGRRIIKTKTIKKKNRGD